MESENSSWSNADIEFPSTSNSDDIEQELNVTTQLSDLSIGDKISADVQNENENESLSKFVLDCADEISSSPSTSFRLILFK